MPEMRGKKSGKGDYTLRRGKASNSGTNSHQQRGVAHYGPKIQTFIQNPNENANFVNFAN